MKNICRITFICCMALVAYSLKSETYASPASQAKVAEGRALLFNNGDFSAAGLLGAHALFKEAYEMDDSDREAGLFLSITSLPALMDNEASYAQGLPMENVKELLDAFGVDSEGRDMFNWLARFSEDAQGNLVLPESAPANSEVQNFIESMIIPEIDAALSYISGIDETFQSIWTASESGESSDTEVDYGDVLLYKSCLHAAKGALLLLLSYDVDVANLDEVITQINGKLLDVDNDLITPNPQLLTLLTDSGSRLQSVKESFISAIDLYQEASEFIRNEADDQTDDLVSLDEADAEDEQDFSANLSKIKDSLTNNVSVEMGGDALRVDFNEYFEDPFDLRENLPIFRYDPETNELIAPNACTVPDRTFSDVLPDGLPDCALTKGDIDNSGRINLRDAVIALKILTASNDKKIYVDADINGDGRIGLEEAVHALTCNGCFSADNDGDGYGKEQGDCNDDHPFIYPNADEICGDGIDQDCDGVDSACVRRISAAADYEGTTTLPGNVISTFGTVIEGESDAFINLKDDAVARNATGDAITGWIWMELIARGGKEDDVDMPELAAADLVAAGFSEDAQAYLANFNAGDEVTFASFSEMSVEADIGGEAVVSFTQTNPSGLGPCYGGMRLGTITGLSVNMNLPVFGFFDGVVEPVQYASVKFNESGNYFYIAFRFSRMGVYRCGWFVPRVDFTLDEFLSSDCKLTLKVEENGPGMISTLTYAFNGDFGGSETIEGSSFTVFAGNGVDQTAKLRLEIYYELPFGYTRPYFRNYRIGVNCQN